MIDEERIQKRNRITRDYQEQVKKARYVEDGHFITLEVYKNFLKEHGYILTAYDGGGDIDWDCKTRNFFQFHDGFDKHLSRNIILVGNSEEWGKYMDGSYCKNIVRNPFVKYISTSFTKFKIYTIIENESANIFNFGSIDGNFYKPYLEKDLSKEWIKHLVKICPEFAEYQIKECEKNKKEAEQKMVNGKNLLLRKLDEMKAEMHAEEERLSLVRDEENKRNDEIIATIEEAKGENVNLSI